MTFLLKTVETYRVANDREAQVLINEAKNDKRFELVKSTSEKKCTKAKGEVIDEWIRVTLTKAFTSEKEPDATVSVNYTVDRGVFPDPIDDDEEEDE